jgi:hypothetical protein
MPAGRPEEYLDPSSPNYDPSNPAVQGAGQDMAVTPQPQASPEGQEALMQPIQEMSNAIVELAGVEALAQVLQQGLQMIMQEQQPEQQEPQLPSAAPAPGGEAFGASYE